MNSQDCGTDQDQDHPHNDDSGVWPRPGTRCLDSRNPHCFYRPEARKTRIILRAVTSFVSHDNRNGGVCDWSVTSHTGLWLADNVPMYHCTSHYPCLSLVSYPSPEHADCIHRYRLGTGAAETVVMLVLPSHCSSHPGEPGWIWQNHFAASQNSFLNLNLLTRYKI